MHELLNTINDPADLRKLDRKQLHRLAEELRAFLLEGVLRFTQSVGGMPGVTRIALVGCLVTEKVMPKGADLLVTRCRISSSLARLRHASAGVSSRASRPGSTSR